MIEGQFERRKAFSLEQFEKAVSSANNGHIKIAWSEEYREYALEIRPGSSLTKILFAQIGCMVWGGTCQLYITGVDPEGWQVHLICVMSAYLRQKAARIQISHKMRISLVIKQG
jgi:hypothetical protein